jgi:hypothetical protein
MIGTILFGIVGIYYASTCYGTQPLSSRKSFNSCEDKVKMQIDAFTEMELVYFVVLLIFYLVTFIGSLWFAWSQKKKYREIDIDNTTMKDFALFCEGWPICKGSEKVEDEVLRFLTASSQFGAGSDSELDIVGVSMCWKYRQSEDLILGQLNDEMDLQHVGYARDEDDAARLVNTKSAKASAKENDKKRSCCDTNLECIDVAFGIGNCPCADSPPDQKEEDEDEDVESQKREERVVPMLNDLETTGCFFITFGKTKDRATAFKKCKESPLVYEKDGERYDITVSETECEPLSVLWNGFGTNHTWFLATLVFACLAVFTAVIILDIFFYAPYVIYILSYSNVAGMSQGGVLSGFLLGLLICVCNAIIYFIISKAADYCSWSNGDSKDCFYCVKYTIAVFFNTLLDLGTVLILAQGYSVDQAMEMQVAHDSAMSPKAVAESPNMQEALCSISCVHFPWLHPPAFCARAYLRYILTVLHRKGLGRLAFRGHTTDGRRISTKPSIRSESLWGRACEHAALLYNYVFHLLHFVADVFLHVSISRCHLCLGPVPSASFYFANSFFCK